ncbi:MAG TPA: amino acid--tRNA ligase-related protein, partial [Verrucomicrobiae bacterium]|nr:amino acid--tRNA ligase-related protein [Verrucomicrobiae bacterium]
DFYLRIALELYLKRLLVGGVDKVFEIGRNFRNEGLSRKHNPEFTMLEAYQAFGDYESMMELVESMVKHVAQKVLGTLVIYQPRRDFINAYLKLALANLPAFDTAEFSGYSTCLSEIEECKKLLPDSKETEKLALRAVTAIEVFASTFEKDTLEAHTKLIANREAEAKRLLKEGEKFLLGENKESVSREMANIQATNISYQESSPSYELIQPLKNAQSALARYTNRLEINLTPAWRRVKYKDLVREKAGADWFEISRRERFERAIKIGIDFKGAAIVDVKKRAFLIQNQKDSLSQIEWDKLVQEQIKAVDSLFELAEGILPEDFEVTGAVFEKLIEPTLIQPTFVTHLPKELVPLAKLSPDDPTTVEVFECCINGQEIAPAYTEQNDPVEQRERLEHQAGGEQQKLDEDFLVALEHGMPPAGGMGMGIDRLCMMLLGQESIRDVILFPQLKPK